MFSLQLVIQRTERSFELVCERLAHVLVVGNNLYLGKLNVSSSLSILCCCESEIRSSLLLIQSFY